jgi:hypothetical protein
MSVSGTQPSITDYVAAFNASKFIETGIQIKNGDTIKVEAEVQVSTGNFEVTKVSAPAPATVAAAPATAPASAGVTADMSRLAADAVNAAGAANIRYADVATVSAAAVSAVSAGTVTTNAEYFNDAQGKATAWVTAAESWNDEIKKWITDKNSTSEEINAANAAKEEATAHVAAAKAKQTHINAIIADAGTNPPTNTSSGTKADWNTTAKEWKTKADSFSNAMAAYVAAAASKVATDLNTQVGELAKAADTEVTKSTDASNLLSGGGKTKRRHRKRKYRGSAKKRVSGKKH